MRLKFILFTLFLTATSANAATDTTATKNQISFKYTNEVDDKFVESDVVRLDDKKGFSLQTRAGDFLLKPYILVQTAANLNYYDDEGLNLADQDNIANSGFSIPNAILGFSGKAFNIITFNFALNASKSGANLLQQAWFDINIADEFRIRAGKFKTPFNQAYLVTLGETLFPALPLSLTSTANVDMSLNAVNPSVGLGFDLGIQFHGLIKDKLMYQVGVFNGNGGSLSASKTMSDDNKWLPSLLYTARIALMPLGNMPSYQGAPDDLKNNKLLFDLSANYNVEAEEESANDFRCGAEFSWLYKRFFLSGEFYYLRMNWTERMQLASDFDLIGGYAQAGFFVTKKFQPAFRYDFFNRNGLKKDGFLNSPALALNYFFMRCNLKLQLMYQYVGKYGHKTQLDRDNDDTGLPIHTGMALLQYSF
ncbi:MAG: porin [Paludibacteraceae bacterium]|nr:porin [Paludibacteraceae bacterium]